VVYWAFPGCTICGSIPGPMNFLRSPFHHSDLTTKLWKSEKNAKYDSCGFQNSIKFKLKISPIRSIRIIRKNLLIRIIRIFRQQINSPKVNFEFRKWKRCEIVDHVRPRGWFERPCRKVIFTGSSFAGLFHCKPLAASQVKLVGKTFKYSTNLHNPGSHPCASFDVSLNPQKYAVL